MREFGDVFRRLAIVALWKESGNGRELIDQQGEVISTHTYNGVTIERIRLPQGVFRRVIKDDQVLSFTNLSLSKHGKK